MTAIVGVLCRDGAVIGTDSSALFTAGQLRTIEQPTDKLFIVAEHVIVAGTGQVGMGQRFGEILRRAWDNHTFRGNPIEVGKQLCIAAMKDFGETSCRIGQFGALVAFPSDNQPALVEFPDTDFQPELKTDRIWYCSMGSAQLITDPFLALMREVFWNGGQPPVQEGVFAATWTLDHAIRVNPGGVNGPARIAVLERAEKGRFKARLLDDAELAQHRQNVDEAKQHLREFRRKHEPSAGPNVPTP